jgi:phenylalanyl-tRNA synthetase beta chain
MKISYNWLKQYINTELQPDKIAELLTDGGLEVESIETYQNIKGGLQGLVIGQVLTCDKHPDADRLKITTVNVGNEQPLTIVCGAPNVAAGQKVVVALVGTRLFPTQGEPFEIKKSKIRGVVSEGMICAEDEIGLGTSHDGIIVLPNNTPVGIPASQYFNVVTDSVFEIGLTPNRTDAMSHIGVARDLAALIHQRLKISANLNLPKTFSNIPQTPCPINVLVEDADACPRYSGLYFTNVTVKPSPPWLIDSLAAIGVRSINNVVDITNYVMHECGQPLHAFDADSISGKTIRVGYVNNNTPFVTLDGVERKLQSHHLLIKNETNAMCIAGVFGGLNSGVSEKTTSIFLESAYFKPASVRKTARELQLKTDSGFRFERGTDINATLWALQRAAQLLTELANAKVASNFVDIYPKPIHNKKLTISTQRINKYIGKEIQPETICSILTDLQITIINRIGEQLEIEIPTFKTDVINEADVIEEILRVYGLNNINIPSKIKASLNHVTKPNPSKLQNQISNILTARGFNEIMTLSLTKDTLNKTTETLTPEKLIELLNPVSNEVNMLRQSLLPGALQTIAYNLNRKQKNLRLFEFGKVYFKTEQTYLEEKHLSLTVTGQTTETNWQNIHRPTDFFYLKENIITILNSLGINENQVKLNETQNTFAQYSFNLIVGNKTIGYITKIKNTILKKMDIDQEVYYANILFDELITIAQNAKTTYKEIPKFPEVKRDLALLVDKHLLYNDLLNAAIEADKRLIKNVTLFDIYEGDKLPEGKKSYALSFTLVDEEATLTDKNIEKTMNKILKNLQEKVGATLR